MAAAMIDFGARGAEAAAKVFISAMVHPVGTGGVHAEFEKGTEGTEGAEDAEDVDGLDGAEGEVQMYAAAPAAPAAMATFDWLKAVCDAEGTIFVNTQLAETKEYHEDFSDPFLGDLQTRDTVASGAELRILPLGDSITYGYQPDPGDGNNGNGYRLQLQKDLSGSRMTFVGSIAWSGNMANNNNEGHPGATISQIEGYAGNSLASRPNVVLIHAGTNDLHNNEPTDPYASAPDRLRSLIQKVISVCPDATILVAQIIHAGDQPTEERIATYNAQVPGVVAGIAKTHKNIAVVDFGSVTANDLIDGLHPRDSGYKKMGDIWFAAIRQADANGWIQAPVGSGLIAGGQECAPANLQWYRAQNGAQIAGGIGGTGADTVFADINGDGVDDYVFIDQSGVLKVYVNGGPTTDGSNGWVWAPQGKDGVINNGAGASRDQVHLADINGDGKADFLIVDQDSGATTAYLNGGPNSDPSQGYVWLPVNGQIASGIGRDGKGIRFADINGDGKADYCWIGPNGELIVYINVFGEGTATFVPYNNGNPIATGVGGSRDEIRLADINGDGRADYLRVHAANGATDLWLNEVGTNPSFFIPQHNIAAGVGAKGEDVQFARLTRTGRADYIPVVPSSGAISPWLNGCKA
ncbi:MAG: hypothetical protein L6R37_006166 [Teloschistes peruensis]|nr:MAG: hypothetical protein L6R37_006166 [Teloschistes peruensis]